MALAPNCLSLVVLHCTLWSTHPAAALMRGGAAWQLSPSPFFLLSMWNTILVLQVLFQVHIQSAFCEGVGPILPQLLSNAYCLCLVNKGEQGFCDEGPCTAVSSVRVCTREWRMQKNMVCSYGGGAVP